MKKLALTIAIVLGLSMTTFADGGGLFKRGGNNEGNNSGYVMYESRTPNRGGLPGLPDHGETGNQPAPLGSGIAVLMGLGTAYLVGKRRKE